MNVRNGHPLTEFCPSRWARCKRLLLVAGLAWLLLSHSWLAVEAYAGVDVI